MSKICPSCGTSCQDSQNFCPSCGAKLPESPAGQQNPQQPGGAWQTPPAWQQPAGNFQNQPPYGQNQQNPYGQNPQQGYGQVPPNNSAPYGQPGYGMGPGQHMSWFKFIIYFQLFASAVVNGIFGIMMLFGAHYGVDGEAEAVYYFFPSLNVVDKLYAVVLIALAVYAIVIRGQLARFQAKGPKNYLSMLLINAVTGFIYVIAVSAIISGSGIELDYANQVSQMILYAVMFGANYVYFKKRAALFVN